MSEKTKIFDAGSQGIKGVYNFEFIKAKDKQYFFFLHIPYVMRK